MKLKLIDVLDIIENGGLEEGARVIWDFKEYIYNGRDSLWRMSEHCDIEIFEDICLGNLREEVELIFPKKNKECEHIIEGYDIDGYEIEEIDYVKWAMATKDVKLQILMDKIKELTQKTNSQTTVLLSQEREIKQIKEQLDY